MASRLGRAPVLARAGWPAVRSGCWGDRLLTSHAGALGPEQLRSDADLADLSSLTYGPTRSPADLAGQLQAKGLNLVAEGTAPFTRWFVAEDAAAGVRTLCCRGVSWTHPSHDSLGLAKALLAAWPAPAPGVPGLSLHSGVAGLAQDLAAQVGPWLDSAPASIRLVGHSLGGSLVQALLAQRGGGWAARGAELVTFGSPPVLALDAALPAQDGAGGEHAMLSMLGLPSARHYVLGKDPVPGLLLSAKPLLTSLGVGRLGGALGSLLGKVAGSGAAMPLPPPTYQALGPVYLLRWNQSAGHSVVRLTPADVAAELAVDVEYLGRNPMQLMKALMDHQHTNYAQDLLAAASNAQTSVL